MTIDELKTLLDVKSDVELAKKLDRGVSAISNWRKAGMVPSKIETRARKIVDSPMWQIGDHSQVTLGGTSKASMYPECAVISGLVCGWDDKKRKKLLRYALELDDE